MGNLVFKPATGGGNKVIFQNQAGNTALTVDDAGAIAIAGNTTLSGTANDLGTSTAGTFTSGIAFPSGHVLQVQGTHNDYNWGSIGHSSAFHMTWLDVVLTTRGTNSNFYVIGRFNADDTNSATFGMGIGFRYQPTGGSQVTISAPHPHELYIVHTGDKYMYNMHHIYESGASIAKGVEVTFQAYGAFNNSNGQKSNSSQHGSSQTIMEIQA